LAAAPAATRLSGTPPAPERRAGLFDLAAFGATAAAAYLLRWDLAQFIWGLWLSSLTVGYALIVYGIWSTTFPRDAQVPAPTSPASLWRVLPGLCGPGVRLAGAAFLLAFFTVHFGMFHFVHAVFLGMFFPLAGGHEPGFASVLPNAALALRSGWPLVVGSAISHRAAFSRARTGFRPDTPYRSVIRMHILIFVFAGARIAGWDSRLLYLVVLFFYFFPFGALRELLGRAPQAA
jgi:Family of unknown function (DUF6498)